MGKFTSCINAFSRHFSYNQEMSHSLYLYRVFLVRDSSSVPNSFVLTMFAKSVPKNFQIMPVSHRESM